MKNRILLLLLFILSLGAFAQGEQVNEGNINKKTAFKKTVSFIA
jgi:hypothetical protein